MRKKYGHIIWMAMAMLMGMAWSCCSSDDSDEQDVPVTGTPIAFSAKEGEETAVNNGGAGARESDWGHKANNITRATSLSDNGVTSFTVWGYKNLEFSGGVYGGLQTVFPGYIVNWIDGSAATTTSNTNGWEYVAQEETGDDEQTIKYWDWGAKAYRFFGVTAGTPTETAGQVSFTMTADASSTANIAATPFISKLWFSTGSEALYPTRLFGKPVQLEFMKPFARVRFMFTYSYEPEGNRIKEKSFKPTDGSIISRKGSFTVRYPLTGTETKESYSLDPDTEDPNDENTLKAFTEEYIPEGTEKWYMVLPNNTQGSYTMTIKLAKDTEYKTAVVPAEFMQWKPGYSYTYIFKITAEGGVEIELVQSAFTPWTDVEMNHDVYNW